MASTKTSPMTAKEELIYRIAKEKAIKSVGHGATAEAITKETLRIIKLYMATYPVEAVKPIIVHEEAPEVILTEEEASLRVTMLGTPVALGTWTSPTTSHPVLDDISYLWD